MQRLYRKPAAQQDLFATDRKLQTPLTLIELHTAANPTRNSVDPGVDQWIRFSCSNASLHSDCSVKLTRILSRRCCRTSCFRTSSASTTRATFRVTRRSGNTRRSSLRRKCWKRSFPTTSTSFKRSTPRLAPKL